LTVRTTTTTSVAEDVTGRMSGPPSGVKVQSAGSKEEIASTVDVHDVGSGEAINSPRHDQWLLDEALIGTFPASDPVPLSFTWVEVSA
jgi:hypothetical protein